MSAHDYSLKTKDIEGIFPQRIKFERFIFLLKIMKKRSSKQIHREERDAELFESIDVSLFFVNST